MEFLYFIGRFHPIVLHLPIGLLLLAFVMEIASRRQRFEVIRPAISFVLAGGMITALISALLGHLLHLEGGYDLEILTWHARFGYTTAALSVVLYFIHTKIKNEANSSLKKCYMPIFVLTVLAITLAGHNGGSLTHGSQYLTEHAPQPIRKILGLAPLAVGASLISNIDSAFVFKDIIQPVLQKNCVSCHNPGKAKGALVMNTAEGIQKGGENGPILIAGVPKKSPLIQRIHLKISDKKHMPPKGKNQLTKEEIKLLEWWIEQGASFDQPIATLQRNDTINDLLQKRVAPPNGIFALTITPASKRSLTQIRAKGIKVFPLAYDGSPYLEVQMSDFKQLDYGLLKNLKKVANQVISLDLGNTNVDDQMLDIIKSLPHLVKIRLDQTAISDKGIKKLQDLQYLEYLNIYGTKITDKGLAYLKNIKSLRSLYLWQTPTSDASIEKLANALPLLYIDNGIKNDSTFNNVKLKPPIITVDKALFTDTLQVKLTLAYNNIDIRYTLDGTTPDTNAIKYEAPFTIDRSVQLQAIATAKGWQASDAVAQELIKIKYEIATILLDKKPNEQYKGSGSKTLKDLKRGTLDFKDGNYLGYQKEHLTTTLDLGKSLEVEQVTVSALESTASYIFYPKGLTIWASDTGKNFEQLYTSTYPTTGSQQPSSQKNFTASFDPVNTRYLKVKIHSNLFNPKWHPAPGAPCWIFIDEILVR